MRLIDADKLYDWVRRECNPYGKPTIDFESGNRILDMIKRSSTAFDKKRVIEKINREIEYHHEKSKIASMEIRAYSDGAERAYRLLRSIVEKGGIE